MRASDIPARIQLPFAASAGGGYIRSVPVPSQIGITDGAASFTDGFPPLNFLPVAGGGIPPFGQDFNGLLNVMSAWDRWTGASGSVPFDSAFATEIGGYPQGARVISTTGIYWWICCVDNNTADPDGTGVGWAKVPIPIYMTDTGTSDLLAVATNLPITAWSQLVGVPLFIQKGAVANVTSTPTLTITANAFSLGAKTIVRTNGAPLNKFDLVQGGIQQYFYDGTKVQIMDPGGGAPVPFLNRFTDTTPGTRNFTAQVSGPHRITLNAAGGAGGAAGVGASIISGGGAGGGQVIDIVFLTAGVAYSYTVGGGGTATSAPNDGNAGGNTSFAGGISATGGPGGKGSVNSGIGVGGGTGSGFSANGYVVQGGSGFAGSPQIAQGGQGGNGAGFGGQGGQASFGSGNPGIAPGGGGSGVVNNQAGGVGANGQFVIEW